MDDLYRFIEKQKVVDPAFALAYAQEEADWKLGKMLAAEREKQGISQTELATRIGSTRSSVCRYERQPVNMTLATLQKVANALGHKLEVRLT